MSQRRNEPHSGRPLADRRQCLLLALQRHVKIAASRPLLGGKRTSGGETTRLLWIPPAHGAILTGLDALGPCICLPFGATGCPHCLEKPLAEALRRGGTTFGICRQHGLAYAPDPASHSSIPRLMEKVHLCDLNQNSNAPKALLISMALPQQLNGGDHPRPCRTVAGRRSYKGHSRRISKAAAPLPTLTTEYPSSSSITPTTSRTALSSSTRRIVLAVARPDAVSLFGICAWAWEALAARGR